MDLKSLAHGTPNTVGFQGIFVALEGDVVGGGVAVGGVAEAGAANIVTAAVAELAES
jgi:hypothetical protein